MGYAPFFGFEAADRLAETIAQPVQAFPKVAHVHMHRAGPVRFPQLAHTLAHEHERHPPPFVLLDPVERAADRERKAARKRSFVIMVERELLREGIFYASMRPFRAL